MNPSTDPTITPVPNPQPVVGYDTVPQQPTYQTPPPAAGSPLVYQQQPNPVYAPAQTPNSAQAPQAALMTAPTQYAPPADPALQQPPLQNTQYAPNVSAIPTVNIAKQQKITLALAIGSLLIFIVGLLFGFAALAGVALGVYSARKGKIIRYTPAFVVGIIGVVLNAGFYLLAVLVK